MDIVALSMIMSQSKVQQTAGIAVMKMAMDTGKETGASSSANLLTRVTGTCKRM
ncbi:YjfB family protein [Clostridium sp.]|uniref:YjfB family protein n=1 Tax=Clostridium sp. TaxID=1506 RepID=UPI003D6D8373